MKPRRHRAKPSRRWLLPALAALTAAFAYARATSEETLRAHLVRALATAWGGEIGTGEMGFTPWGGLRVKDLRLSDGPRGALSIGEMRVHVSPFRALLGESLISEIELDRPLLTLPARASGETGLPPWPFRRGDGAAAAGDRRGRLLITAKGTRIVLGGKDALALPLVAVRCGYLRAGNMMDLTGEIAGPHWASGTFRLSYGNGACQWDAALHRVALVPEVRDALWAQARHVWDDFSPSGTAEVSCRGTLTPRDRPAAAFTVQVETRDASISYRGLPIPFRQVHGTLVFDESGRLDLKDFWGLGAGGGFTTCEGSAQLKGEHAHADLDFTVQELPLVPVVLSALPEGVRAAWAWCGADGRLSGRLRLLHDRALPEPICLMSSWSTENLILASLPLQPAVKDARVTFEGRLAGGRPVGVSGSFEVPAAELSGRRIHGMRGHFAWDGPRVSVDLDESNYASGVLMGTLVRERQGEIWANKASLDLSNALIEQVKLGTVMADQEIHGSLSGHMDLAWTGNDPSTLSGRGEASVEDGYLFSLPPLSAPLAALSLNLGGRDPVIRSGKMLFGITPDVLSVDYLELPSAQVLVRAHGTLRKDGAVDMRVVANPGGPGVLRKIPVVKETAEGLRRFMNWVQERGLYCFRVKGTIRSPKVETVRLFGLANSEVEVYRRIVEGRAPEGEAAAP